jgi:hypothetical protein
MAARKRPTGRDRRPAPPQLKPVAEVKHVASPTAVAAEALRTGVLPPHRRRHVIPRDDDTLLVGDPDDRSLDNAYVGDETPGGSSPTPDQNEVDEIGRAYGLQEEDSGALRSAAEVLDRRDRKRTELQPPNRPR